MTGLRVWLHPSSRTKISGHWLVTSGQQPFRFFRPLVTDHWPLLLHSAPFRRAAAVMWNRGNVANRAHLNACGSQGANRRLAAGAGACNANVHAPHAVISRHVRGIRCGLLRREGRTLARPSEAERSRTLPRQNVAVHVGDGHDRVIEGSLHIAQPVRHVLALLLLEGFLLAFFLGCGCCAARCCWFCHESVLSSQFPVLSKPGSKLRTEN